MITRHDLDAAIAECMGEREPNANTCIKMAAYYTIRQNLYPETAQNDALPTYSFAANSDTVHIDSDTEFARAVEGLPHDKIWALVDELVETVRILQPRVYAALLRKINEL